jgi:type IV secretory pathway VirJ component
MRAVLANAVIACIAASAMAQGESVGDPTFFRVVLTHATPTPPHVVLFVSGDGGWNEGVRDMSATMAALDTLVIGIDIRYYMRTLRNAEVPCSDVAGDLAALARTIERRLGYPRPVAAWLAGYSSGATLVYAALVQAPPGTFRGAMSFGFCPDLPLIKPMCLGNGLEWDSTVGARGFTFRPSAVLQQPWVAFQGDIDQVCSPAATRAFVAATAHGEVVELAKVGHGFAVLKNWRGQFDEVFRRLQQGETASK